MATNPYPALPPLNAQLTVTNSNLSYSHNVPVDCLETEGAKAGNVLYVNKNGDAVWGDPLEIESERYMDDPFLKDSYEKYRAARAELEMRIKLQKDAENGKK